MIEISELQILNRTGKASEHTESQLMATVLFKNRCSKSTVFYFMYSNKAQCLDNCLRNYFMDGTSGSRGKTSIISLVCHRPNKTFAL